MRDVRLGRLFAGPVSVASVDIAAGEFEGEPTASLYPEELAYVPQATARRLREYAGGRAAARAALAGLGQPAAPILRGVDREPIWPSDCVGSISHGADLCWAAVAARSHTRGLGIDVEPALPMAANLVGRICRRSEIATPWMGVEPRLQARFIFSCKEAFYKCYFMSFKTRIAYLDVEIDLYADEIDGYRFSVNRKSPEAPWNSAIGDAQGRGVVFDGRIFTTFEVAA